MTRSLGAKLAICAQTVKPDSYYHGIGRVRPSVRSRAHGEGECDGWRGVRTAPVPAPRQGAAASRAFTASPGADTEFKIPLVMTRRTVRAVRTAPVLGDM